MVCPVGAVSRTTKPCSPSATVRANALNTAISSVQGDRKSSSSSAMPCASSSGRRLRQDGFRVLARLDGRIDPADRQVRNGPADRCCHVRRRVGRAEMDRMAAMSQFDGDGRCDRGFADAALPHRHHDAVPGLFEFVDQGRKRRARIGSRPFGLGARRLRTGEAAAENRRRFSTPIGA